MYKRTKIIEENVRPHVMFCGSLPHLVVGFHVKQYLLCGYNRALDSNLSNCHIYYFTVVFFFFFGESIMIWEPFLDNKNPPS